MRSLTGTRLTALLSLAATTLAATLTHSLTTASLTLLRPAPRIMPLAAPIVVAAIVPPAFIAARLVPARLLLTRIGALRRPTAISFATAGLAADRFLVTKIFVVQRLLVGIQIIGRVILVLRLLALRTWPRLIPTMP